MASLQQELRNAFENQKEFMHFLLAQKVTATVGEITGIDSTQNLVQVSLKPYQSADVYNPGDLISPWIPMVCPVYGVRGMPQKGDQAIILYSDDAPLCVIGFTYNAFDTIEENVNSGQYRITKKVATTEADILVDGNTGNISINKGIAGIARVGDTVSVSGTIPGVGPVTLIGTITSGSDNAFN